MTFNLCREERANSSDDTDLTRVQRLVLNFRILKKMRTRMRMKGWAKKSSDP